MLKLTFTKINKWLVLNGWLFFSLYGTLLYYFLFFKDVMLFFNRNIVCVCVCVCVCVYIYIYIYILLIHFILCSFY